MGEEKTFRVKYKEPGRTYWVSLTETFSDELMAEREAFALVHSKRAEKAVVLEAKLVAVTEVARVRVGDADTRNGPGINIRHPNIVEPSGRE